MKPFLVILALVLSSVSAANSAEEDSLLKATFIAFQEPGVFSSHEIKQSRQLLVEAANQGNILALQVMNRQIDHNEFVHSYMKAAIARSGLSTP